MQVCVKPLINLFLVVLKDCKVNGVCPRAFQMLTLFKIKIVDFFTLFKTNHFVSPTGLGTSHNLSWRRGGGKGVEEKLGGL